MTEHDSYNEEKDTDFSLESGKEAQSKQHIEHLYQNWFLDYASYVILERAIPSLVDGLKPVQRRILHAMKKMDDGRFHKIANVIGQTMQYHPHGDASIGEALVNLGQKKLLIETQGNWGDIRTGDSAAAPRYIEGKLSKFAMEVLFYEDNTIWQASYDGRNKEPETLPVKFPLLLAQGAEGIAVGLSTKILPHNFIELVDSSIAILQGEKVEIFPDFPCGGIADVKDYNQGQKGGKVRVRARMEILDAKTLRIYEIPYGTTTTNLIESIIKANDDGKIKIKKIMDRTAQDVEIYVELLPGTSPDVTMDALYAFTDCEISLNPICCVIRENRPEFLEVSEVLRLNTLQTKHLLGRELEIELASLQKKRHALYLEKIFISRHIYQCMEECKDWDSLLHTVHSRLLPFEKEAGRSIEKEDAAALTELKFKQIARYNLEQADRQIKNLSLEIERIQHNMVHLTEYAIAYFQKLREKYGKGWERKTTLSHFETIQATQVAAANQKLYANRKEGFIGYGLKKDEFLEECSDLDDIIVFLKNGICKVVKVADKIFVGKDIIHAAVWRKNDTRMVYNLVYQDTKTDIARVKRFHVTSVIRDKEYNLAPSSQSPKVLYLTANPRGETEVITVHLNPLCKARNKAMEFDFASIEIKGKDSQGNILCKYPVSRVSHKATGAVTFAGMDLWYDKTIGRLNTEKRGEFLGHFTSEDAILVIDDRGYYQLTSCELTNHYDIDHVLTLEKFSPETVISVVHYDGEKEHYFVKRFQITTKTSGNRFSFISENPKSRLVYASTAKNPWILLTTMKKRPLEKVYKEIDLSSFVDIKGWKATGNRLSMLEVVSVSPCDKPKVPDPEQTEPKPPDDSAEDTNPKHPLPLQENKEEKKVVYIQEDFLSMF